MNPSIETLGDTVMVISDTFQFLWISPIIMYIEQGVLPSESAEAALVKVRESSYTMAEGTLCIRGLFTLC